MNPDFGETVYAMDTTGGQCVIISEHSTENLPWQVVVSLVRGPANREQRGGGGRVMLAAKTDNPIEDSPSRPQKTFVFYQFCVPTAIGVSLFKHQFHYVSCEIATFAHVSSGSVFFPKAIFDRCMAWNSHFCDLDALLRASKYH